MGIAMEADTTLGETAGGIQAPYVFEENGTYYMYYGDWRNICLATSTDGKNFTRVINESGTPALFGGPLDHSRDPMVLKIGDTYYCYYSDHPVPGDSKSFEPQGAIYCKTSKDMKKWSEPIVVSRGGSPLEQTNWYAGDIECPFVVEINGKYILFRNQLYGRYSLNTQYCSSNPLDFGDGHDDYMTGQLHVAAPEIVKEGDQYYIVALKRNLDGMRVTKIKFVEEVVTK
jgi:beta-xylosidase